VIKPRAVCEMQGFALGSRKRPQPENPFSVATELYSILGVARSATEEDIKRAYRAKAKDLHPDRHPGDVRKAEAFKQLSAAYDILGDAEKRAAYDRGDIDADGNPVRFAGARTSDASGAPYGDPFDDLFSSVFGASRSRRSAGPQKGRDLVYRVEVPFEDAVTGGLRRLTLADGNVLDVKIPAGVDTGRSLRLRSKGQASPSGGPPGDLILEITVKPGGPWARENNDLHHTLTVDLKTAILGGLVELRAPSGPVSLKIPPGSNTGTQLRLRGRGVQADPAGDLYVKLQIVLTDPKDSGLKRWAEKG
jgi:DnaJ-class molecular chaperone